MRTEVERPKGLALIDSLSMLFYFFRKCATSSTKIRSLVLSMGPDVLLLDEPMAGLEERAVERFLSVLKDESFKAFVVITHMPRLLEGEITRALFLEKGRLSPGPPC